MTVQGGVAMSEGIKKMLRWWLPIILLSPFLFILIITVIVRVSVLLPSFGCLILLFDFSEGITIVDYLNLYIGFAGIGVALFLGIAVYQLGEDKEDANQKKQISETKEFILKEIRTVLDKINEYIKVRCNHQTLKSVQLDNDLLDIDKSWKGKIVCIKNDIDSKLYDEIYQLFTDIGTLMKDKNLSKFLKNITVPFYTEHLQRNEFTQVRSIYDVLNFKMYRILNMIEDKNLDINRKYSYENNNLFYEEILCSDGLKYIVYNLDGEKIFDSFFADENKSSGFMTIYNWYGEIIMQGEFENGKQVSGIIKNASCNENGDYLEEPRKLSCTEILKEEFEKYKKEKSNFAELVADFEIENGKHKRVSDLKYIKYHV